jgi:hypothetical protein
VVPRSFSTPTAAAPASADLSTIVMNISRTEEKIDGSTIDGIAARGIKNTVLVTSTSTDSSCTTADAKITSVKYVDPNRDEPAAHYDSSAITDFFKAVPTTNCRFVFASGSLATPPPSSDDAHFSLYTRSDTELTVPSLATPVRSTMLVERGNVRTLGTSDATLFEIPAGFTAAPQ